MLWGTSTRRAAAAAWPGRCTNKQLERWVYCALASAQPGQATHAHACNCNWHGIWQQHLTVPQQALAQQVQCPSHPAALPEALLLLRQHPRCLLHSVRRLWQCALLPPPLSGSTLAQAAAP